MTPISHECQTEFFAEIKRSLPNALITDRSSHPSLEFGVGSPGKATVYMCFDPRSGRWDVLIYPVKGGMIPPPQTAYVIATAAAVFVYAKKLELPFAKRLSLALDYRALCRADHSWCDLIKQADRLFRLLEFVV
jgi:hypothetical protein